MKVVIIDYGMGNIRSIIGAIRHLNINDIVVTNDFHDIKQANRIILPGVGSFKQAMNNIKRLELDKILQEIVMDKKTPLLGICLGMQLLTNSSDEDGYTEGLGFIDAECKKFNINFRIPHVGFNQVEFQSNSLLFRELENKCDFYFVHSYRVESNKNINQSYCEYGEMFIASFEVENIYGVQFHPELSQTNGLKLLDNFLKGN